MTLLVANIQKAELNLHLQASISGLGEAAFQEANQNMGFGAAGQAETV